MTDDPSGGWEAIAANFIAGRSDIGSGVVRQWAKSLRPGADVVDIGCGSGVPISLALVREGLVISGIDASPTLLSAFRQRFPEAPAACEPAQHSAFFGRKFDAAVAVGLIFLLSEDDQRKVIKNVARALPVQRSARPVRMEGHPDRPAFPVAGRDELRSTARRCGDASHGYLRGRRRKSLFRCRKSRVNVEFGRTGASWDTYPPKGDRR